MTPPAGEETLVAGSVLPSFGGVVGVRGDVQLRAIEVDPERGALPRGKRGDEGREGEDHPGPAGERGHRAET